MKRSSSFPLLARATSAKSQRPTEPTTGGWTSKRTLPDACKPCKRPPRKWKAKRPTLWRRPESKSSSIWTPASTTGSKHGQSFRRATLLPSMSSRYAVRTFGFPPRASRSLTKTSPRSPCPHSAAGVTSPNGTCRKTCPAPSPTPQASTPSNAKAKTPRACLPEKVAPSAPISASTTSRSACRPSACPRPSIRSRCTAAIQICVPTSTARWATPG